MQVPAGVPPEHANQGVPQCHPRLPFSAAAGPRWHRGRGRTQPHGLGGLRAAQFLLGFSDRPGQPGHWLDRPADHGSGQLLEHPGGRRRGQRGIVTTAVTPRQKISSATSRKLAACCRSAPVRSACSCGVAWSTQNTRSGNWLTMSAARSNCPRGYPLGVVSLAPVSWPSSVAARRRFRSAWPRCARCRFHPATRWPRGVVRPEDPVLVPPFLAQPLPALGGHVVLPYVGYQAYRGPRLAPVFHRPGPPVLHRAHERNSDVSAWSGVRPNGQHRLPAGPTSAPGPVAPRGCAGRASAARPARSGTACALAGSLARSSSYGPLLGGGSRGFRNSCLPAEFSAISRTLDSRVPPSSAR